MKADEILQAMQEAMAPNGKVEVGLGVTTRELAEATGRDEYVVRNWLRRAIAEGRARVVRVKRAALDGRILTVSAYTLA